jgi:hypothetical protein
MYGALEVRNVYSQRSAHLHGFLSSLLENIHETTHLKFLIQEGEERVCQWSKR